MTIQVGPPPSIPSAAVHDYAGRPRVGHFAPLYPLSPLPHRGLGKRAQAHAPPAPVSGQALGGGRRGLPRGDLIKGSGLAPTPKSTHRSRRQVHPVARWRGCDSTEGRAALPCLACCCVFRTPVRDAAAATGVQAAPAANLPRVVEG